MVSVATSLSLSTLASLQGWTPLHRAAFNGQTKICRMLVEKGANPAVANRQSNTCLHLSASQNRVGTVEVGREGSRIPGWRSLAEADESIL